MKLCAVSQNPMEWIALKAGLLPMPLLHTQIAFVLSKAVLDAYELQVFEVAKSKPLTLGAFAKATQLDQRASCFRWCRIAPTIGRTGIG